ncbi:alpha/beta hydrolase [Phaeobacter marinintestinus]|uniref:alpha/beta hydrolase n=1 Tax=Falsiphaeobacter marinintestinus TaxID=1492905 RepID=UPI0011B51A69|nr:alpha/beta hydrolase [Phaeobacter marinintestinus]
MNRAFFGAILACGLVLGSGVDVKAQEDPGFATLAYLVDADPDAALDRISDLLDAAQAEADADPRVIFDLYRLAADLLIEGAQIEQAAQIIAQLAAFAVRFRDTLDVDPVPLFAEAAALMESEDNQRGARDVLITMLDQQRDGAEPATAIADTIRDITRLSEALNLPLPPSAQIAAEGAIDGTRSDGTGGFREVDVYYATDRAQSGKDRPSEFYGNGRGDLELGVATVTVPEIHTPGVLEAPSIWRLEFRADPAKHVVLQSIEPLDPDSFYGRLQGEFTDRPEREAFVFIHGYNVRFDQAARRAAQMAYDMNYDGVPVLYSWPSFGSTVKYVADTAVVRLSGRRLSTFLEELLERSGAETIHVVAHSMGNRALTDALELMALRMGIKEGDEPLLGQVVFAAPDVDAGLFQEMLPTIHPLAERLTLYASDQDWALTASRKLHGNALRAGLGGPFTLTNPVVDSVDMSQLGDDMLAHSYFADDSSALADMMTLFWQNADPIERCGMQEDRDTDDGLPIWRYQSGVCADRNLLSVLAHLRRAQVTSPLEVHEIILDTVLDVDLAQKLESVVSGILGE